MLVAQITNWLKMRSAATCKTYTGCEPTPTTADTSDSIALRELNCSKSCESYKTCFFPPTDGSNRKSTGGSKQLCSTLLQGEGGLWLLKQSIFSGWRIPYCVTLNPQDILCRHHELPVSYMIATPYQKAVFPTTTVALNAMFSSKQHWRIARADGEYHACGKAGPGLTDPKDDVKRGKDFVNDTIPRSEKYKKPCNWKRSMYQTEFYTGEAGDKMFQVATNKGNSKVVES